MLSKDSERVSIITSAADVTFEPIEAIAFDIARPLNTTVFDDVLDGLLKVSIAPEFVVIYSC